MDPHVNVVSCDVAAAEIDAAAVGEAVSRAAADHIASCPVCAPRLALAQRIDTLLRNRPIPVPPATFTANVIARVRQERWKTEQVVDFGFNLAVAAGLALIVCGLAGFAWQLGALPILDTVASLLSEGWSIVAPRVATDTRLLMIGLLLATTAVGVWWWAEEDVAW